VGGQVDVCSIAECGRHFQCVESEDQSIMGHCGR
jgi:hypothetical protein